jgi:formylglycine-generating enzyme required for sulfatase activity
MFSKRNGDVMSAVLSITNNVYCADLNVRGEKKTDCKGMGNWGYELVKVHLHLQVKRSFSSHTATLFLFLIFIVNAVLSATQITGTVLDADTKAPLKNAIVSFKSTGDLVLTDESGKFTISPTAVINQNIIRESSSNTMQIKNGVLSLYVEKQNSKIELKTYTLTGKQISSVAYTLSAGTHSIVIPNKRNAAGSIICKLKINSQVCTFPLLPKLSNTIIPTLLHVGTLTHHQAHTASSTDTLLVSKYLYIPQATPVVATISILLQKPATTLPPPGMKAIPGGTFMMGSNGPFHEQDEIPVHNVTISPFFMDSTEVTQADYKLLMGVEPWVDYKPVGALAKYPGAKNNLPVWYMTWNDAALYCNQRSKRDGLDTVYKYKKLNGIFGNNSILDSVEIDYSKSGYRLPTEAEWEYAARAGTTTEFYWGDKYDSTVFKYAWFASSSEVYGPIRVATLLPNQFGLFDVIGNVYELVNDYLGIYSDSEVMDPIGPVSGSRLDGYARAIRGGSWNIDIHNCRVARRFGAIPNKREPEIAMGFRVALPNK